MSSIATAAVETAPIQALKTEGEAAPPRSRDVEATFNYLTRDLTPSRLQAVGSLACVGCPPCLHPRERVQSITHPSNPETYTKLQDPRRMLVRDVAGRDNNSDDEFSLDTSGFAYVRHRSALVDEIEAMSEEDIRARYWPETAELVKTLTGASLVRVISHARRVSSGANAQTLKIGTQTVDVGDGKGQVGPSVHVDMSAKGVRNNVEKAFGEGEARELMKQRFQVLNVWRPLRPVFKDPFAVADIRTQEPTDVMRVDVVVSDTITASPMVVHHNPAHRWYYKHAQRPDEPVVFKQFDSADRRCLGRIIHTGFTDEEYERREPRSSIEVRVLAFHEDQRGIPIDEIHDRVLGSEE